MRHQASVKSRVVLAVRGSPRWDQETACVCTGERGGPRDSGGIAFEFARCVACEPSAVTALAEPVQLVRPREVRAGRDGSEFCVARPSRWSKTLAARWNPRRSRNLVNLGSSEIGGAPWCARSSRGWRGCRWCVVLGLGLVALAVVLAVRQKPASATPVSFATPFWTVTAGVQEKHCSNCGCEMPSPFVLPGVSVLTGELVKDIPIASTPTLLGSLPISLRWRSGISGGTDFGLGIIPRFMTTVEETGAAPT